MMYEKCGLYTNKTAQQGFSLIELSVVLIIIGLLMGTAASLVEPYIAAYRYNATKAKMDKIADALALYVQTNYDLPCPAKPVPEDDEPFGTPVGSGEYGNIRNVACSSVSGVTQYLERGIVPFKALGLTEDQVRDAWGSYFTYTVAPLYDRYKENHWDRDEPVHHLCRTEKWIDAASGRNKNIRKAQFCCPHHYAVANTSFTNRDNLIVFDKKSGNSYGDLFIRRSYQGVLTNPLEVYDGVDVLQTTPTSLQLRINEVIAFTLISHGMNRRGSVAMTSAAAEYQNSTTLSGNPSIGSRFFASRPLNTSVGNDYFDDIVVYRTNHQLVSALGNNSCMHP